MASSRILIIKIFFSSENRQFRFSPKPPYDLVAEIRPLADEATSNSLTFTRLSAHQESNLEPSP